MQVIDNEFGIYFKFSKLRGPLGKPKGPLKKLSYSALI